MRIVYFDPADVEKVMICNLESFLGRLFCLAAIGSVVRVLDRSPPVIQGLRYGGFFLYIDVLVCLLFSIYGYYFISPGGRRSFQGV